MDNIENYNNYQKEKQSVSTFMFRFVLVMAVFFGTIYFTTAGNYKYTTPPLCKFEANGTYYCGNTSINGTEISADAFTTTQGGSSPYSYLIYTDSMTVYAKNGSTGKVDYSGSNATAVIQNIIDTIDNSYVAGSKKKVLMIGDSYILPSPIYVKNGTILEYHGILRITNSTVLGDNIGLINIVNSNDVELIGLTVDVNRNNTVYHAIYANNVNNFTFRDLTAKETKSAWITKLANMSNGHILNTQFYSSGTLSEDGLHLQDSNNITIDGARGKTADDFIALEAKTKNISDITISNVVASSPCCNIIKLLANWRNSTGGNPVYVQDITINNVIGYGMRANGLNFGGDYQAIENSTFRRITATNLVFKDFNFVSPWACSGGITFNCDNTASNGNGTIFQDIYIQAKIDNPVKSAVWAKYSQMSNIKLDIDVTNMSTDNGIVFYSTANVSGLDLTDSTINMTSTTYAPVSVIGTSSDSRQYYGNLLKNADLESWSNGITSTRPDGWANGNTVDAKNTTYFKTGTASANVTSTGAAQFLSQRITTTEYQGKILTFGAWVYATTSGIGIRVDDSVETGTLTNHPGDGQWHYLVASKKINPTATWIQPSLRVSAGNISAEIDSTTLVEGIVMPKYTGQSPLEDDGYSIQVNHTSNNVTIPQLIITQNMTIPIVAPTVMNNGTITWNGSYLCIYSDATTKKCAQFTTTV